MRSSRVVVQVPRLRIAGPLNDSADRSLRWEGGQQISEKRPNRIGTPCLRDESEQQAQGGNALPGPGLRMVTMNESAPEHSSKRIARIARRAWKKTEGGGLEEVVDKKHGKQRITRGPIRPYETNVVDEV